METEKAQILNEIEPNTSLIKKTHDKISKKQTFSSEIKLKDNAESAPLTDLSEDSKDEEVRGENIFEKLNDFQKIIINPFTNGKSSNVDNDNNTKYLKDADISLNNAEKKLNNKSIKNPQNFELKTINNNDNNNKLKNSFIYEQKAININQAENVNSDRENFSNVVNDIQQRFHSEIINVEGEKIIPPSIKDLNQEYMKLNKNQKEINNDKNFNRESLCKDVNTNYKLGKIQNLRGNKSISSSGSFESEKPLEYQETPAIKILDVKIQDNNKAEENNLDNKKKKIRRLIFILVVLVIIALMIFLIIWFSYSSRKKDPYTDSGIVLPNTPLA